MLVEHQTETGTEIGLQSKRDVEFVLNTANGIHTELAIIYL